MTALGIPTPDPRTFDDESRPFAEALAERYAIKRVLGRGGMGIVYLARDKRLDRLVAIKTLPAALASDPTIRDRFVREARTAAGLAHANIVAVHGADELGGHVFFVMAYVAGDSLAARIEAHGRLDPGPARDHLRDVASALDHAHCHGVIHRDIKAENILIDRASGRALVTDFGVARLAEAAPTTATGQMLGTVHYVSPEQVSGDVVDFRTDLYSAGVVGFLALAGRFPFESPTASAVLVAHVTRPAPPLAAVAPHVPRELAMIIDRCLAKRPDDRYASAAELLAALERVPDVSARAPAMAHPQPRLISNTEAHEVWHRAAELQASTGIIPRLEAVEGGRNPSRTVAGESAVRVDHVREAAEEAGIETKYVEHALIEHGLAAGVPREPRMARVPELVVNGPVASRGLRLVQELEVSGEVTPREFARVVRAIYGTTDTLTASRALVSREGGLSDLMIEAEPADGTTVVRVSEDLSRLAKATVLGSVMIGTVTWPVITSLVAFRFPRHVPGWGPPNWALGNLIGIGAFVLSVLGGIALFQRLQASRRVRVGELTKTVVQMIREQIRERVHGKAHPHEDK